MAAGRPVRGLPGVRLDGFEGIKCMQDPEGTGSPPRNAIAMVLTDLAGYLEKSVDKVEQFARLILEIRERFPTHFAPPAFITMSDEQRWPEWTDLAVPELFVRTGPAQYFTWEPVYELAQELDHARKLSSLCFERVVEVLVSPDATDALEKVGRVVEEYRYMADKRESALIAACSALEANRWQFWPSAAASATRRMLLKTRQSLGLPLAAST
jgi:hypothetical protein